MPATIWTPPVGVPHAVSAPALTRSQVTESGLGILYTRTAVYEHATVLAVLESPPSLPGSIADVVDALGGMVEPDLVDRKASGNVLMSRLQPATAAANFRGSLPRGF